MNARGQIAAMLGASFVIVFLSKGWVNDVRDWVLRVTTPTGPTPPRPPHSGFAPDAGQGGQDSGGGGGGRSW